MPEIAPDLASDFARNLALPDGMKAVVHTLAESPEEGLAQVTIVPQAAPDPAALGPRDCIVRVRAAHVGWVDLLMTSGQYQHAPRLPYTPGLEHAGEVVYAPPGVAGAPGTSIEGSRATARPSIGIEGSRATARPSIGIEGSRATARPSIDIEGSRATARPSIGIEGSRATARPSIGIEGSRATARPSIGIEGSRATARPSIGIDVGARVIVDGLQVGPRSSGPYQAWGGFATYSVAPVEALVPIPDALDFDQAAGFLGSYETAYHCLVARGRLAAGETVLVLGASGATGLAAVHVAKAVGARVIAVGRSRDKLAVVQAEGADHVIATGETSLRDAVRAITGDGVDVVYDGVGGELSLEALRCVRFGARFVIVGWAATPAVARGAGGRGAPNANQLPTNLIMMKGLDVLGAPMVIGTLKDPSLRPPRLARLLAWAADGAIRPHVSHRFALADVVDALRARWRAEPVGGCVVNP